MSATAAITAVLVGVAVFIISQFVLKLTLEPVVCVRRTIADVSSTALFNQANITNASRDDRIAEELWTLSSRLRADVDGVLLYNLCARWPLRLVPSKHNVSEACGELNLLAYGMQPAADSDKPNQAVENSRGLVRLGQLLNTKTTYGSP